MNQTQHGMTGTGSPFTWVVVGSGTQFVTQLTVSVGNTVVGNVGIMMTMASVVVEVEVVVPVPVGCAGAGPLHGHGGGRMVRGTGVAVMLGGRLVGVMTKGGGLTLRVGRMTEGTAPSSVVEMST